MLNFSFRSFVALFIFLCVSSVCAQIKVVVIPLFGDNSAVPNKYAIGDIGPAGGIIFHVTNGGINGLEAAPIELGVAPWNCVGTDVAGVDNVAFMATDPNSGAVNTPLIAVQCPGSEVNAAILAAVYVWPNGQTDGFLPNKEELSLLYEQRAFLNVVGGFSNNCCWSSSEFNSDLAWLHIFGNGSQFALFKTGSNSIIVRAIRAF